MNRSRLSFRLNLSTSALLGILLALVGFCLAFKTIGDLDFWWHLATGRWIAQHQSIVRHDVFSFTFRGAPWVDLTWGFELLIYLLYSFSHAFWPVTAAMALLAAGTVWVAWRTFLSLSDARAIESSPAALFTGFLVFLVSLSVIELRWIDRPEQLTHWFGAIFLFLLWRNWDRARGVKHGFGTLWAIPLLQILWVNTHGLFILGPAILGFFLTAVVISRRLGESGLERKRWISEPLLTLLVVTTLVCWINPRGSTGALFPLHLWKVLNDPFYKSTIPEATPALHDIVWGFDAWAFVVYTALLAASFLVSRLRKSSTVVSPSFRLGYLLLSMALVWVSLPARRNISLLVIWTLPWLAHVLAGEGTRCLRLSKTCARIAACAIAGAVIAGLVTNLYRSPLSPTRFGGEPSSHVHPAGAAKFVQALPEKLRFFAGVHTSDYLLFAAPGFEPYLDGRFAELYSKAHFQRYMDVLAHPWLLQNEVARYGIDAVAVELGYPMGQALIRALAERPEWKLAFFDETVVIFILKQEVDRLASKGLILESPEALVAGANARLSEQFASAPSLLERLSLRRKADLARAQTQLAEALLLTNKPAMAATQIALALKTKSDFPKAILFQCLDHFQLLDEAAMRLRQKTPSADPVMSLRNEIDEVRAQCEIAMYEGSEREAPLSALGLLEMRQANFSRASERFEEVVRRDPLRYEAYLMLGRSYLAQGSPVALEKAEATYRRAATLRPYDPTPVLEMGNALRAAGEAERAKPYFAEAEARSAGTVRN